MLTRKLKKDVPTADVVVTNPTEFAVALKYDSGTMHAPRVVAKGQGLITRHCLENTKAVVIRGKKRSRGQEAYIPPATCKKVIDFVGMRIDAARARAQHAKIKLGQVVWTPFGPSGKPRGEIVRQNPPPGTQIDPFEEVSLQVSAGPGEYGYLIRQVHASATVPPRNDAARPAACHFASGRAHRGAEAPRLWRTRGRASPRPPSASAPRTRCP